MGRDKKGREARLKGRHTAEEVKKGINLHLAGVSLRQAAKDCNVPYPTLRRYVLKYKTDPSTRLESAYDVNKVFTHDQELSLREYLIDCADRFYGLTTKKCRFIAFQMASINQIEMPPTWIANKMAGRDWLRGFRKRHPDVSLKKAEACSLARATAFNEHNVKKFFDNLKNVMNRQPSFANGHRIYNLDETSTTTVQRPQKVLCLKGRNASKVTSGERGVLVTTCCIVNALGQALPPAMVFPRVNFKPHMLNGAPPGTLGLAAPSGWMNTDLFVEVMKHFIKHTSSSKENPSLLIMDNHESHLSIEALDLAKASGVTVLTLHPHTTAKMQPLDVGLNGPFKVFYNSAIDSWLLRHPGKPLTIYDIAECVGMAYLKAMTPSNIVNAFRKCGIFPYDDKIFTEIDFLPSSVTNRTLTVVSNDEVETDDNIEDIDSDGSLSLLCTNACDQDERLEANHQSDEKRKSGDGSNLRNTTKIDSLAKLALAASGINKELHKSSNQEFSITSPTVFPRNENRLASSTEPDDYFKLFQPSTSTTKEKLLSQKRFRSPSTNDAQDFIPPKVFRTPLKAPQRNTKRRARKAGKSLIATDTPEKDALAERKKGKAKKITKHAAVKVKQNLFNEKNLQRPRKKKSPPIVISDSSDDEEQEEFLASGSSSGGDQFVDSDDEELFLTEKFSTLIRNPQVDDYVIILFKSKKNNVYYVAKIIEVGDDEDEFDFFVSYLKLKSKFQQKFAEPLEPDTAGVNRKDIMFILPKPKVQGTSRRQVTYKFPVNMSLLNLRY